MNDRLIFHWFHEIGCVIICNNVLYNDALFALLRLYISSRRSNILFYDTSRFLGSRSNRSICCYHVIRKGNISSVRTHTFMELGDCILIKVDGDSVSVLES